MRTTVDLPDSLMTRVKRTLAENNLTFRALVVSALEQALEQDQKNFQLRDASVGGTSRKKISSDKINQMIEDQRTSAFNP